MKNQEEKAQIRNDPIPSHRRHPGNVLLICLSPQKIFVPLPSFPPFKPKQTKNFTTNGHIKNTSCKKISNLSRTFFRTFSIVHKYKQNYQLLLILSSVNVRTIKSLKGLLKQGEEKTGYTVRVNYHNSAL